MQSNASEPQMDPRADTHPELARLNSLQEAVERHQAGESAAAGHAYLEHLRQWPDDAVALHHLALLQLDRGAFQAALDWVEKAAIAAPQHHGLEITRSQALVGLGRTDEAREALVRARAQDPEDPEAGFLLGRVLLGLRRWDEALEVLGDVRRFGPEHAEVWELSGVAASAAGETHSAREFFAKALELEPDRPVSLSQSIELCLDVERALDLSKRFSAAHPKNPTAWAHQSRASSLAGDSEGARQALGRARELSPTHPAVLRLEAWEAIDHGDRERAAECLGQVLDQDPHAAEALEGLARIGALSDTAPIDRALEQTATSPRGRSLLHFARGQVLHDQHQWPEAFQSFHRANQVHPAHFDLNAHVAGCRSLLGDLSPDRVARWKRLSPFRERRVFLVGLPRCGSSLIEQALAAHPQVHALGEHIGGHHLVKAFHSDQARWCRDGSELPEACSDSRELERLQKWAHIYRGELAPTNPTADVQVDKLLGNIAIAPLLKAIFPNAVVVWLRRDPRDVLWSNYRRAYVGDACAYSYDPAQLLQVWWEQEHLGRHWSALLSDFHTIDYERFVTHPESDIRRLLTRIALPFEPNCLNPELVSRAVRTSSALQVREPIHRRASGTWRNYATQLTQLWPQAFLDDPVSYANGLWEREQTVRAA